MFDLHIEHNVKVCAYLSPHEVQVKRFSLYLWRCVSFALEMMPFHTWVFFVALNSFENNETTGRYNFDFFKYYCEHTNEQV